MTKPILGRPWIIVSDDYEKTLELFTKWFKERGGIAVYENHMMDSSCFGDRTFMPVRYYTEDDKLHDAPARIGDVPSRFQERVDTITLEEFDGDLGRALSCFVAAKKAG